MFSDRKYAFSGFGNACHSDTESREKTHFFLDFIYLYTRWHQLNISKFNNEHIFKFTWLLSSVEKKIYMCVSECVNIHNPPQNSKDGEQENVMRFF